MTPEEIEELRALAGRLNGTAYNENLAAILGAALEHIDQQDAQVAALQEIAISERERRHISDMSRFGFVLDSDASPDPRKLAADQLAKEHPEAFR